MSVQPTLAQLAPPTAPHETFHVNSVEVEGIVTKVWARRNIVYARLAIYDQHAELLAPSEGNASLPRRKAHYVTIMLPDGKTSDGVAVSIGKKDRVRATGFIREVPYTETLRQIKVRAGIAEQVTGDDDALRLARVSTYVVAETLVRFG